MRLVLDSNVIIAAFATRGLCQSLFEFCLEQHQILLGEPILKEIRDNLRKKIKLPVSRTDEIISFLKGQAVLVSPAKSFFLENCPDPDDLHILGLAVEGEADLLITGDKALLALNAVEKIPIISPRDFWLRIRKGE